MANRAVNPAPFVIERLDKHIHNRMDFDCGAVELNDYLRFIARQHVYKGYAQVWVAVPESGSAQILGYYSLSVTSLAPAEVPRKTGIKKIPALLLGKLAVDRISVRWAYPTILQNKITNTYPSATTSISTPIPKGKAAAWMVVRAGGWAEKKVA